MPESPVTPNPTLQTTALRYAAGELTPAESGEFEAQLADNQEAREALAEVVRLSAAALGQTPPAPHRSFLAAVRERLAGWCPGWLARRAYRGHPLVWAGTGAMGVAACAIAGFYLTDGEPLSESPPPPPVRATIAVAPPPQRAVLDFPVAASNSREEESPVSAALTSTTCGSESPFSPSVAELWAEWSTPESLEKTHEDERKWRQKLRDAGMFQPTRSVSAANVQNP